MTAEGQPTVSYVYDDADRLTQISQGTAVVNFSYDSINRRAALTLPNGIVVSYGYDAANQLTSLTYRNGTTVLGNLTYDYDDAGRRTNIGGSFARSSLPPAVASVTYDAANRLVAWGGDTLGYDDNGALVSTTGMSNLTYVWDARERLQRIQQGMITIASFRYDAFNRRIEKDLGGTVTNMLHDGWQVVQELHGSVPTANLLNGQRIDEIFRRTAGVGTEDYLTDALGSTIALTNSAAAVRTTYEYEPYGATAAFGDSSSNFNQYTGRENDGGLYYYRNRYYNPVLRRFLSEDPVAFADGSNLYAYVGGNPVSNVDPTGESGWIGFGVIVGGVGGGLYCYKKGLGRCEKMYPHHRDREHPDYAAFIRCTTGVAGVIALGMGMSTDPIGSSSVATGEYVGRELCDDCQ